MKTKTTFRYELKATCNKTERMERAKWFKRSLLMTSATALKMAAVMDWVHANKREAIRFAKGCVKASNGFLSVAVIDRSTGKEVFTWAR